MSKTRSLATFVILAALLAYGLPATAQETEIEAPRVVLVGTPFDVAAVADPSLPAAELWVNGSRQGNGVLDAGMVRFTGLVVNAAGAVRLELRQAGAAVVRGQTRALPGWVSIVPPLLAIAVALIWKQVIPALFFGLWLGATAVVGFSPSGWLQGLLDSFAVFVLGALTDPNQAQIVLFSFMIGGMVGIVIRNGGMQGIVNRIVRWATSARRGQVTAGILGVVIFFDDYANVLVVGNTMRQVTDRLRISREKLAYIVDCTAAPVSSVALVSTWIGYQVGLIGGALEQIPELNESAYSMFLGSISYSFYPFLTMFLVFTLAALGRDFGPMHAAEMRARTTGRVLGPGAKVDSAASDHADELNPNRDKPVRAVNAVLPILTLIGGVVVGLYVTGAGAGGIREILAAADSYRALMWASLLGVMCAALLSLGQRILTSSEVVDAWYAGMKSMLYAMIILVLAWSLSAVSRELHTADYLVSVLGEALNPGVVPAIVFVLAAATAFATGSSWATMGILMPLVLPLVWAVLGGGGGGMHIMYSTVSCVLAGAVLGDHCSPISDTTILSSMASGCDHIDHVRTQLPYAGVVGVVSITLGTLPAGFGMPWWIGMILGAGTLYLVARYVGQAVPDSAAD